MISKFNRKHFSILLGFVFIFCNNAFALDLNKITVLSESRSFSPQKDKTLVVFWASWCSTCKTKLIKGLDQSGLPNDVDILTISMDKSADRSAHFIKKHKIKFPSYHDQNGDLKKTLKIKAVPFWALYKNIKNNNQVSFQLISSSHGFDEKMIKDLIQQKNEL